MPNKIQIKRTTVTGRTPNTTDPANTRYIDSGELSLNLTDGKLFSSNGLVYFEVGGNLQSISVGSVFTANSTRVNSAVNTAIAAIIANGSIGTSGQVLTSNATGIYWNTPTGGSASVTVSATAPSSPSDGDLWWNSEQAQLKIYYNDGTSSQWVDASSAGMTASGGNTEIQFNFSGGLGSSAQFTYNEDTETMSVGSVSVNTLGISVGTFGTTNGARITTTTMVIGNTVANSTLNYNLIQTANSSSLSTLNPTTISVGNSTVNTTINSTTISVGNSIINTTANSTVILVNGADRVATQKRAMAISMIFGR